nr:glutathione S-transferase-like [Tanacetum cinerariifolium]
MTIKVFGANGSTATLRVLACLAEKDLEYEFVTVDMPNKEHKKPEYLSRNPFGQVPALEDGDLKLFESRAITQYLAHTYADKGTDLIIKDPKKMAILAVWIEVESQKFDPAASKLAWELAYKPIFGMTTDDAIVDEYEKKLSEAISLPHDVPNASDRRLIELENQVQHLMEAHRAPKPLVQVKKPASSCEIFSGPHDTQYCMENPKQAFVYYASSCIMKREDFRLGIVVLVFDFQVILDKDIPKVLWIFTWTILG